MVTKKGAKKLNKRRAFITIFIIIIIIPFFIKTNINKNVSAINIDEKEKTSKSNTNKINEESSFPKNVYGVPVHTELIQNKTEARTGKKRKIKYIVLHETDNFEEGVGAKNHATFLKENNMKSTSWHYTVDDTEIYHHIPDNEVANHAADEDGNLYGVGIELCVNRDGNFEKTFENAAKLVAYLLKEYNLTIYDIKTHQDFSGKDCPHSILENNRMNEFKRKVESFMNTGT